MFNLKFYLHKPRKKGGGKCLAIIGHKTSSKNRLRNVYCTKSRPLLQSIIDGAHFLVLSRPYSGHANSKYVLYIQVQLQKMTKTLANTQCASKVHKHCALAVYICSYSGRGHLCTERWALQIACHVTSTTSGTRLSKISRNDLKHARRPDCWCGVTDAQRRTHFHAP